MEWSGVEWSGVEWSGVECWQRCGAGWNKAANEKERFLDVGSGTPSGCVGLRNHVNVFGEQRTHKAQDAHETSVWMGVDELKHS